MADLLDFNNRVFSHFALVSTACCIKMGAMSMLTSRMRLKKGVFANPEDVPLTKVGPGKPCFDDEDVERIRRIHLNDVENIPPFILVGLIYVMTKPNEEVAIWHFRLFALARVLHTISYRFELPQPTRAICFFTGLGVTLSMAGQVLKHIIYKE